MATAQRNNFDFNHIDTALSKGTIEMLKSLYAYYHKKHYGYEKLYRTFQRKNLLCNIVAGKAVITSAVAGGITLNPVVLATEFDQSQARCQSCRQLQKIRQKSGKGQLRQS